MAPRPSAPQAAQAGEAVNPVRGRPSKAQLGSARGGTVPDVLAPRLEVVFCGINPSLYSAAVGHHFARPGNRFWQALHLSGLTPRVLAAYEDGQLIRYGAGITNLVPAATARAGELPPQALRAGAEVLAFRMGELRPRFVAIAGVTAYRIAFGVPRAQVGGQERTIGGVAVWLLPNPSGLNAHYRLADLATAYADLHRELSRTDVAQ
ncbi:MAG: G/U mismatch-specific DNA glycosylase [Actinomycetota bacterium]